jgi:Cupin-like domain
LRGFHLTHSSCLDTVTPQGPKRSGSVFHIDPNATHAWNACIQGRKRWIFYPPGCPPPGVFPSEDGDEVAIPLSVGEWLLQYWSEHVERSVDTNIASRPTECTVYPGDVIFVPHGYWHMVVNLDDTNCAITHNYVSPSNLGNVLKFFSEKQEQISGCRDRSESIKPEHLHEAIVEALAVAEPKILRQAQEQKQWSCGAWKDNAKRDAGTVTDKEAVHAKTTSEPRTSVMARMEKVSEFSFSFL